MTTSPGNRSRRSDCPLWCIVDHDGTPEHSGVHLLFSNGKVDVYPAFAETDSEPVVVVDRIVTPDEDEEYGRGLPRLVAQMRLSARQADRLATVLVAAGDQELSEMIRDTKMRLIDPTYERSSSGSEGMIIATDPAD